MKRFVLSGLLVIFVVCASLCAPGFAQTAGWVNPNQSRVIDVGVIELGLGHVTDLSRRLVEIGERHQIDISFVFYGEKAYQRDPGTLDDVMKWYHERYQPGFDDGGTRFGVSYLIVAFDAHNLELKTEGIGLGSYLDNDEVAKGLATGPSATRFVHGEYVESLKGMADEVEALVVEMVKLIDVEEKSGSADEGKTPTEKPTSDTGTSAAGSGASDSSHERDSKGNADSGGSSARPDRAGSRSADRNSDRNSDDAPDRNPADQRPRDGQGDEGSDESQSAPSPEQARADRFGTDWEEKFSIFPVSGWVWIATILGCVIVPVVLAALWLPSQTSKE